MQFHVVRSKSRQVPEIYPHFRQSGRRSSDRQPRAIFAQDRVALGSSSILVEASGCRHRAETRASSALLEDHGLEFQ